MRWKCPTCKRWTDEPIMMRCESCQEMYNEKRTEDRRDRWEAREDAREDTEADE